MKPVMFDRADFAVADVARSRNFYGDIQVLATLGISALLEIIACDVAALPQM
jgi:hypothetical protein